MSWQPRAPMPPDFCGRPPCPKCYGWAGGDEPQSLARFAFELLGRQANGKEINEAQKIAKRMHKQGLNVTPAPDLEPPSDTGATFVDIGMTPTEYQTRMLKQMRQTQAPKIERKFTCDEVSDRQAARDERARAKEIVRQERLSEAREIAKVFSDAQQQETRRREYDEQRYLRDVDPSFVSYMRDRGVFDPREIAMRWAREYGGASARYMVDPMSPIKSPFKY